MKSWSNEDKSIIIANEDAIKFIDLLIQKEIKVDCIITDPPYNIAKDNNFNTMGRAGIDFGEWDKGFDLFSWLNNIEKITKSNGSMIIFNDWKNIGNIAKYCEDKGFEIKDMLRWKKQILCQEIEIEGI